MHLHNKGAFSAAILAATISSLSGSAMRYILDKSQVVNVSKWKGLLLKVGEAANSIK